MGVGYVSSVSRVSPLHLGVLVHSTVVTPAPVSSGSIIPTERSTSLTPRPSASAVTTGELRRDLKSAAMLFKKCCNMIIANLTGSPAIY